MESKRRLLLEKLPVVMLVVCMLILVGACDTGTGSSGSGGKVDDWSVFATGTGELTLNGKGAQPLSLSKLYFEPYDDDDGGEAKLWLVCDGLSYGTNSDFSGKGTILLFDLYFHDVGTTFPTGEFLYSDDDEGEVFTDWSYVALEFEEWDSYEQMSYIDGGQFTIHVENSTITVEGLVDLEDWSGSSNQADFGFKGIYQGPIPLHAN